MLLLRATEASGSDIRHVAVAGRGRNRDVVDRPVGLWRPAEGSGSGLQDGGL